jgi:hypothetical protein
VTGIKETGHTGIQPLLCRVAEAVAVDWISRVSRVLLMTGTTREDLQLPLSHICFTIRFLSEYSGGNFAPADFIIMIV